MTSRDSGSCEGIENRRLVNFARCSEVIKNRHQKINYWLGSYGVHILLESFTPENDDGTRKMLP